MDLNENSRRVGIATFNDGGAALNQGSKVAQGGDMSRGFDKVSAHYWFETSDGCVPRKENTGYAYSSM